MANWYAHLGLFHFLIAALAKFINYVLNRIYRCMGSVRTRRPSSVRCSPWQDVIPPELLAKVFEYITEKDLLKAGRTCKQWYDVCILPRFWTKRRFCIKGENEKEVRRVSGYMATFGCHLQHMCIDLELSKSMQTESRFRRVISELQELLQTKQQLKSIVLLNWWEVCYLDGGDEETLLTNLCYLLERQENLSEVKFVKCDLFEIDDLKVLQALATPNTASSLKSLTFDKISDALSIDTQYDFCSRFLEMIGRFRMLVHVGFHYHDLSDEVLTVLISANPYLKEMMLVIEDFTVVHEVPDFRLDWRKVVKKRPGLGVYLVFRMDATQYHPFHAFVLPDLPLIGLSLYTYRETRPHPSDEVVEKDMNDLTGCINHRLKVVILARTRSEGNPWNRPATLAALVKACPSLTHLSLQMTLTLDTLLQIAAAAHSGTKDGDEGGHRTRSPLKIHIQGCDQDLGNSVLDRVSEVNPLISVHVCDGCQQLLESRAFV